MICNIFSCVYWPFVCMHVLLKYQNVMPLFHHVYCDCPNQNFMILKLLWYLVFSNSPKLVSVRSFSYSQNNLWPFMTLECFVGLYFLKGRNIQLYMRFCCCVLTNPQKVFWCGGKKDNQELLLFFWNFCVSSCPYYVHLCLLLSFHIILLFWKRTNQKAF